MSGGEGYSDPKIRPWLRRLGIEGIVLTRSNHSPQIFDAQGYRDRNHVERPIEWLKLGRRLAPRSDRLVCNYLAFIKMPMIQRCLRMHDPPTRSAWLQSSGSPLIRSTE